MLEIIVATDQEGGFGKDGKIPWYHPEDLKHFKEITTGNICLMGRKTYEDMLEMRKARDKKNGKSDVPIKEILPNRLSFVITSNKTLDTPGAVKAKSIEHALSMLDPDDPRHTFVIGGEQMYVEALPRTGIVHRTIVPGRYGCDRFFPISALDYAFTTASIKTDGDLTFYTHIRIE